MISVFGSKVGQEELQEISSSLQAQWMGIGPKTAAFEKAMAARLGVVDFTLLDSGSNSLIMALKLLDLPAGGEVILPALTWIACAHAVLLAGCKPVFCDVELDTQNLSAATIAPHITSKTCAIMVVHYAGKPVRMDEVLALGLPVVEDAAHAVDSRLGGKPCGGIGDVGIYSFDAVKNLAMGEGGGLTARDPEMVARARQWRYCGIGKSGFQASADKERWWEYQVSQVMPKFLPNDVMASIGLAQLAKLDELQAWRKRIWELYQTEFSGLDWLKRPVDGADDERHSYFTYFVRLPAGKRDRLAKHLYERGIYTTLRYHPLHLYPVYGSQASLPVSEQLNEEGLNLPLHPNLSWEQAGQVVEEVRGLARLL
jgi:aminotransferase